MSGFIDDLLSANDDGVFFRNLLDDGIVSSGDVIESNVFINKGLLSISKALSVLNELSLSNFEFTLGASNISLRLGNEGVGEEVDLLFELGDSVVNVFKFVSEDNVSSGQSLAEVSAEVIESVDGTLD